MLTKGEVLTRDQYSRLLSELIGIYKSVLFEMCNRYRGFVEIESVIAGLLILGSVGDGFNSNNQELYPHVLSDIDGVPLVWRGNWKGYSSRSIAQQFFWDFDQGINAAKSTISVGHGLDLRNQNGSYYSEESIRDLLGRARVFSNHRNTCYLTHNNLPNSSLLSAHADEGFGVMIYHVNMSS